MCVFIILRRTLTSLFSSTSLLCDILSNVWIYSPVAWVRAGLWGAWRKCVHGVCLLRLHFHNWRWYARQRCILWTGNKDKTFKTRLSNADKQARFCNRTQKHRGYKNTQRRGGVAEQVETIREATNQQTAWVAKNRKLWLYKVSWGQTGTEIQSSDGSGAVISPVHRFSFNHDGLNISFTGSVSTLLS